MISTSRFGEIISPPENDGKTVQSCGIPLGYAGAAHQTFLFFLMFAREMAKRCCCSHSLPIFLRPWRLVGERGTVPVLWSSLGEFTTWVVFQHCIGMLEITVESRSRMGQGQASLKNNLRDRLRVKLLATLESLSSQNIKANPLDHPAVLWPRRVCLH